jgi:hypothetical protein
MRRREFIAGLGSAAAWPAMARAQQLTLPVVAFFDAGAEDVSAARDQLARRSHPGMTPGDEASGHLSGAGSATSDRRSQLAVSFTS